MENKISIKTQTNRATNFKRGYNCVNLFLNNFEVGLKTTEWGNTEELERAEIIFSINGHDYIMDLETFKEKVRYILNDK